MLAEPHPNDRDSQRYRGVKQLDRYEILDNFDLNRSYTVFAPPNEPPDYENLYDAVEEACLEAWTRSCPFGPSRFPERPRWSLSLLSTIQSRTVKSFSSTLNLAFFTPNPSTPISPLVARQREWSSKDKIFVQSILDALLDGLRRHLDDPALKSVTIALVFSLERQSIWPRL